MKEKRIVRKPDGKGPSAKEVRDSIRKGFEKDVLPVWKRWDEVVKVVVFPGPQK